MVEFGSLLEQYVTDPSSLLISGDLNLHVDDNLDKSSQDFLTLINSFNLKPRVCSPTHRAGHTLDLLITRDDDQLVTSVSIHDAAFSDHFIVNGPLSMEKPLFTKNKLLIVVLRILISIFSSVTFEAPPSSVIRQMNLMI